MKKQNPETILTAQIKSALKMLGIVHWKQHQGLGSTPGVSDILGVLPGGRFLAIEVKTQRGRVSDPQQAFMDNINRNGGLAFVARSVDDVIEGLGVRDRFLF